jgi:hypothetical protein
MSTGLSIEYAHARTSARLSQRPGERLAHQLRACRSIAAQLEAVRASPAASYVSGVEAAGSIDSIEAAFRQQFRLRVEELANWSPDAWKPAIRFVASLLDLPVLLHLSGTVTLPGWVHADAALAHLARPDALERRIGIAADYPWLRTAFETEARASTRAARLHPALQAWLRRWRTLWPACSADERANLEQLVLIIERHLLRFGTLAVEDAGAARMELASQLSNLMRRAAVEPTALFAWLALLALDLERLRGDFVTRAVADFR